VKKGDTIGDIAKLYDVSKNTIIWANDLKGKSIKEGDSILILPVSGVKYTVKKGDTLKSIAKKYKADAENISDFNSIAMSEGLNVGDELIIPDGEIVDEAPIKKPNTTIKTKAKRYLVSNTAGYYMRPIIGGIKTQGIHGHNAIDIGVAVGTPLLATADGVILAAKVTGYNGGYGKMVIISHQNGTQSVYGHLSGINVSTGDKVVQGQVIGVSGNSGKSTGPHLHFEIRGAENPF
jgi:murein DD-endopeptidase MepM/ murein hydrolase activator NlpD